jgi:hypothetical protein
MQKLDPILLSQINVKLQKVIEVCHFLTKVFLIVSGKIIKIVGVNNQIKRCRTSTERAAKGIDLTIYIFYS